MIFSKCIRLTIGNIWENSFLRAEAPDEFLSVQFSQDYFFKDDNLVLWISDGALQKRALLNITQSLRIGRTVCDTIFRITSDCSYFQVNDSMVLLQKYVPGNICLSVQNQHTGQTIQEYEFLKSYIPKSVPCSFIEHGNNQAPEKDLFAGIVVFYQIMYFPVI